MNNPPANSQRWKEYAFLLTVVAVAIAYGVVNDQITCTISPEYFYHHDPATAAIIGTEDGRDMGKVRWAAFLLGMQATWWGGLIVGAGMLTANMQTKRLPVLPARRLFRIAILPLTMAGMLAVALGIAGWLGWLSFLAPTDYPPTWWRRFMCVYGMHLGGYLGGTIGFLIAVGRIIYLRAKTRPA